MGFAQDLKSPDRMVMRVRSPPPAPQHHKWAAPFATRAVIGRYRSVTSCRRSRWAPGPHPASGPRAPRGGDPHERAIELREEFESINPGFHMNKKHWNTVSFETSDISEKLMLELINHSYELVASSLTKKMKEELLNM